VTTMTEEASRIRLARSPRPRRNRPVGTDGGHSGGFLPILVLGLTLLGLSLSPLPAHAQAGFPLSTQYTTVIEYSTTSGYTPTNVNITWTNTNDCGSFSYEGPGATWVYSPTVGNTPCTSSLPSGTITISVSQEGTVLAKCTDTHGAATYGSVGVSSHLPECTDAGLGVTINGFFAQAYDDKGSAIAATSSGGNDDWVIALVVIIVLILLFLVWRRRQQKGPVAGARAASPVGPSTAAPPASGTRFCTNCGSPMEPGAAFCRRCGKAV